MKQLTLFLFLISISFPSFTQQTINESIVHDNRLRTYILYVPSSYTPDSQVPLVFNFHGYTSNAISQMEYGNFRAIADTAGFIIVHPMGTLFNGNPHWNVGGWTIGSTTDDIGFTDALITEISAKYSIDQDRIYATGMSNGGYMSFLLACQLSQKIAAIASVTGSMTPQTFEACDPQHPTPIMQIHGTSDNVVPYFGANWTESIETVMSYWVNYNNCNTTPTISSLPNINPGDGSTVQHFIYEGGEKGVTSEHYKITGGGHTWPGTSIGGPGTNYDMNASLEIWKFFLRYDLNGLISTTNITQLEEKKDITIYPNPATSVIHIKSEYPKAVDFELLTLTGKTVLSGLLQSTQYRIDISHLPQGVYLLKTKNTNHKILKIK